jgi:flagellar biosynthesis/type III secretory pathway chaperone
MNEQQIYQTIINQWNAQYQSLKNILTAERASLENRDFATLERLVNEKNTLLKEINLEQIPAIIVQGKVSQPKIRQVKKACMENQELKEKWDYLMETVDECHFQNEVNARLIELVTASTKRTFNLIKGFDPDNNIYDNKGDRKQIKHFGQPLSA